MPTLRAHKKAPLPVFVGGATPQNREVGLRSNEVARVHTRSRIEPIGWRRSPRPLPHRRKRFRGEYLQKWRVVEEVSRTTECFGDLQLARPLCGDLRKWQPIGAASVWRSARMATHLYPDTRTRPSSDAFQPKWAAIHQNDNPKPLSQDRTAIGRLASRRLLESSRRW